MLEGTLFSIENAQYPDVELEIVVLNNSIDERVDRLAQSRSWSFPLTVISCPERGKSRALNAGLLATQSDLVVFLDDDVLVAPDYFEEVREGALRWPEASGYGGRILIEWPEGSKLPEEVIRYVSFAHASLDFLKEEGYFADRGNPVESNMAFWRSALPSSAPFDPETGPGAGRYRMGSGEPLFRAIRATGGKIVYLPKAMVRHRLREEQLTERWLAGRSFSYGRSLQHFGLSHHDISGQSRTSSLLSQYLLRVVRQVVMALRRKSSPRVWARVDRKLIEGILYERLFWSRKGSKAASYNR